MRYGEGTKLGSLPMLFPKKINKKLFCMAQVRTQTHMLVTRYLISSSIYPLGVVILQPYVTLSRTWRHFIEKDIFKKFELFSELLGIA